MVADKHLSECSSHFVIGASAMVICEIILFCNNFEIILVFCFTCNHIRNWNKISSDAEGVLELFQNYVSDSERVAKYL